MAIDRGPFAVRAKDDDSPVTEADERAEALIEASLRALTPGVPIVAEEAVARGRTPAIASEFWLVDPLDGTREFVARNGEFTVNIALIRNGAPVLGVVHAPALGATWGGATAAGAYVDDPRGRRTIRCRAVPPEGLTVVSSRSHGDAAALEVFLWRVGRAVFVAAGVVAVAAAAVAISPTTFGLNQGLNGASSGRPGLVSAGSTCSGTARSGGGDRGRSRPSTPPITTDRARR